MVVGKYGRVTMRRRVRMGCEGLYVMRGYIRGEAGEHRTKQRSRNVYTVHA